MQWDQMGKLYYTYLENFYIQFEGNLKAFQEHFELNWWKETITKIEFLAGKDLKTLDTKNVSIDFEDLQKKVLIELL